MSYPTLELLLRRREPFWEVDARLSPPSDNQGQGGRLDHASVLIDRDRLLTLELEPEEYGRWLTGELFGRGSLLHLWHELNSYKVSGPVRGVVSLDQDSEELLGPRWELLHDPVDNQPLCSDERVLFSRKVLRSGPDLDRLFGPISKPRPLLSCGALLVISSPINTSSYGLRPIDIKLEEERYRKALSWLDEDQIKVLAGPRKEPTLEHIKRALTNVQPTILLLIAHGKTVNDASYLLLEDQERKAKWVPSLEIATFLRGIRPERKPLLIVSAACHSADSSAHVNLGWGVAAAGVPAVLAMRGNVRMDTVASLVSTFFETLDTVDGAIDHAITRARHAVLAPLDRWQAVLFTRGETQSLWVADEALRGRLRTKIVQWANHYLGRSERQSPLDEAKLRETAAQLTQVCIAARMSHEEVNSLSLEELLAKIERGRLKAYYTALDRLIPLEKSISWEHVSELATLLTESEVDRSVLTAQSIAASQYEPILRKPDDRRLLVYTLARRGGRKSDRLPPVLIFARLLAEKLGDQSELRRRLSAWGERVVEGRSDISFELPPDLASYLELPSAEQATDEELVVYLQEQLTPPQTSSTITLWPYNQRSRKYGPSSDPEPVADPALAFRELYQVALDRSPSDFSAVHFVLPWTRLLEEVDQWEIEFAVGTTPIGALKRVDVQLARRKAARPLSQARELGRQSSDPDARSKVVGHLHDRNDLLDNFQLLRKIDPAHVLMLIINFCPPDAAKLSKVLNDIGVPIMICPRSPAVSPPALHDTLRRLCEGGLSRLQASLRELRYQAYLDNNGQPFHIGKSLTLLWEYPDRPPPPNQEPLTYLKS
jgi:hypothetical protein